LSYIDTYYGYFYAIVRLRNYGLSNLSIERVYGDRCLNERKITAHC